MSAVQIPNNVLPLRSKPGGSLRIEVDQVATILIDAGVEHIRLRFLDESSKLLDRFTIPSNGKLKHLLEESHIYNLIGDGQKGPGVYITGKLAEVVRDLLGQGEIILPAAAFWAGTQAFLSKKENRGQSSLAAIDLSASGYFVIGIDNKGHIKDDLLVVNPRCGAGSGANIDRVLQKLAISREEVDVLLDQYLGEAGKEARIQLHVRADRCGVFSSSATISDKNQGIPLEFALAVTLKSEVMKTCKKLPAGFDKVYLTGGVFAWQFTRDCAIDYLQEIGVNNIGYDTEQLLSFDGIQNLVARIGKGNFAQPEHRLKKPDRLTEFPAFTVLKERYEADNLYRRLPEEPVREWAPQELESLPVILGLDVGSTMAKLCVADARTEEILFSNAYSNCGDTIETIKQIFRDMQARGVDRLSVVHIGITGSARYQVQEALRQVYPQFKERVSVLVENYAHARGSIEHARRHIQHLKGIGVTDINEDFIVLVDIGGEDTKLSTISLKKGELFDNAMNVKCSAGTGSLMDTLRGLFGIESVAEASRSAFQAERSYAINATCAVFLMENTRKLQAQGYQEGEILASANWAIVENMARTMWSQLDLPQNAVVMLHGQTMLSEPLPLAVTHRLQEFMGTPSYCLVPPHPGHMACIGLIKTLAQENGPDTATCTLEDFISREFKKRIIQCRGAVCGDKAARCNRVSMSGKDNCGQRFNFSLGGCSAINEIGARKKGTKPAPDTYKEIWNYINDQLPRTEDKNRLVIPRSFAVSEWAYFFAEIFQQLNIPVHVDNVREEDLIAAQPFFHIDTCAPQIGAVGQCRRLAGESHGMILTPQIEFLPSSGESHSSTCTINQGGLLVGKNLAEVAFPEASFHTFNIDLKQLDPEPITHQLLRRLEPVFEHYGNKPTLERLRKAVTHALDANNRLKAKVEDKAADIIEAALREGRQIAIVAGREYILNPGVYDSHVGRLLRDKQIAALPLYLFSLTADPDLSHIYWRNPHFIVSALRAIADKKLHEKLSHPRLKKLFYQIETASSEELLPVVQVSTFRCGPDSVITPLVAEIMKKRPFLLIQSDAAIKELAHLENRVNTYLKQLELGLHGELLGADGKAFEIRILENFTNDRPLDRETDAIYFPTLSDNRSLVSVVRGAGYTCIDNYDDETYDLASIVKKGRKIAGDSVCAPLAAVYGDILRAVEDFTQRKEENDPLVSGRHRLLFFNNKGLGPCRQGQFSELHKLFSYQASASNADESAEQSHRAGLPEGAVLQFIIAEEQEGYNFGIEEWTMLRIFEGVILQGVLHSLLFQGGALCRDYNEYLEFTSAYRKLKQELYSLQEQHLRPSQFGKKLVAFAGDWPGIGLGVKFFAYRLYARDRHKALRRFVDKWIVPRRGDNSGSVKIYIEGEAYMRSAQSEDIFNNLLATLGFRRFTLEYSPIWSYIAYLLDEEAMGCQDKIQVARDRLRTDGIGDREMLTGTIKEKGESLARTKSLRILLREVLARPLYEAARIPMPESMPEVLEISRELIPTLRPFGELGPYVGEALKKLREGYDIVLNVAPEGCMVSSMGEVLTPKIVQAAGASGGKIQNLFSADGDVDEEILTLALLKTMGPEKFYRKC